VELVGRSHGNDYERSRHRRTAAQRFRTLRGAGLLAVSRIEGYRGAYVRTAPGLQRDFSLFHTLALYLLDTLPRIPPERETYALDILSMVESILEDPDVILFKQLDRAKGLAVAEMKAEGMEYEERMRELEKVEYPKPNRDFVYSTFDEFAAKHPWVGTENIRPKSVARDMIERFMTFADYVRDYELQRSEGLLLRYLSETYKTLVQTVPETYRTDELLDVITFLRTTVRGVDSSLIDEWERLRDPRYQAQLVDTRAAVETLGPPPLWADPRAFAARIRTELHALLVAFSRKDHAAALAALAPGAGWTAAELEQAIAPYWAEHTRIDVTPAARRPHNTILREAGPRRWEAVQRVVDEAGEVDWALHCEIDLSGEHDRDAPLIRLVRVAT
jgi:hypothetical protein